MPKIPNYTAEHEEYYSAYRWRHDEKPNVTVEVEQPNDEYWVVRIFDHAHFLELTRISKNKEEMRKRAVKWMKNNPEGWSYEET